MSVNISVTKSVDHFLLNKAKNNDRDMSYFHASGWDFCHRKIAYAYYESQKVIQLDDVVLKTNPQGERIFDNGHYMHDRWRDYIIATAEQAMLGRWICQNCLINGTTKIYGDNLKLGVTRPEKCECGASKFKYLEVGYYDEETWWGGHVDTIIDVTKWPHVKFGEFTLSTIPDHERYFVVDYKSMNPFEFKDLNEPKPEHITQMQVYLYLSGLYNGKFIYENKANQSVKEFLVRRDEMLIAVKKEEALLLKHQLTHVNSLGKHVLPPRGHDSRGHKECLDCKYRGHCWKGDK